MSLLNSREINSDHAFEAVRRWWRNDMYRRMCQERHISSPEMLLAIIDNGQLERVPVFLDTDSKIKREKLEDGSMVGGRSRVLMNGVFDELPSDVPICIQFSSGANPDFILRTSAEAQLVRTNYRGSFLHGTGLERFDGLISYFPSESSLSRSANRNIKKSRRKGLLDTLDSRTYEYQQQSLAGLRAAMGICDEHVEGLLKFNLFLTILNNTVLKPWMKGALHLTPNVEKTIETLERYRGSNSDILWGTSPITMISLMRTFRDMEIDFRDMGFNLHLHGGGGGYDGQKGSLRTKPFTQQEYAMLMYQIFGRFPTETYGYTGQSHTLTLFWNPDLEWEDQINGEKLNKRGAYVTNPVEDLHGNAIVYVVRPRSNELVTEVNGMGVIRALNFDGSHVMTTGPMQVNDGAYIGEIEPTFGLPTSLYGIRRLTRDKSGC